MEKNHKIEENEIELIPISESDGPFIVELRSNKESYKYFKNPHQITIQEHMEWYKNIYLNNYKQTDYIIKCVGSAEPCGVVGYRIENNTAELNYIIAPTWRKKGIASRAVQVLMKHIRSVQHIASFFLVIHAKNINSIKLAKRNGFVADEIEGDFVYYRKVNVLFQVDSNFKIGLGHMMRCLAIAMEFRDHGMTCAFSIAKDTDDTMIIKRGFNIYKRNDYYDHQDEHAIVDIAKKFKPDLAIIDSYNICFNTLYILHKTCKVMYIDDLNMFKYPVDIILNYNIYADIIDYSYCANVLCGTQYFPLRREFTNKHIQIKKYVDTLIVLAGGSSNSTCITKITDELLSNVSTKSLQIKIAAGKNNSDFDALYERYASYHNVIFINPGTAISEAMLTADIAISAAGTTIYELTALGIPTIAFSMADNQKTARRVLGKKKLVLDVGDISNNSFCSKLDSAIEELLSESIRLEYSENMRKIAIKDGVNHIYEALARIISNTR